MPEGPTYSLGPNGSPYVCDGCGCELGSGVEAANPSPYPGHTADCPFMVEGESDA